ncbi:phage portal protein [Halorhodospira sp. 9622]|uniref:phage portal protein n=1 Tax=Halorhodospira sp. 9622 TaxID=2899136 RepID=UPI001EE89FA7|nr:phage portal protein [Halorhodospira sp. 9622]MCG5538953.1 phage portal protein [Halorhodospira sp. 9622]
MIGGLRQVWRGLRALGAAYEAAGHGRRLRNWYPGERGPNEARNASLALLRARSRDAVRNQPWPHAMIDRTTTNVVGTGLKPMSKVADPELREFIQELWGDWAQEADADHALDFYGLQELVEREREEAGECFVRLRYRRTRDGLSVPMQLQVIEPEQVPADYERELPGGHRIRAGVEFDRIGRRVAYWMYPQHPGEHPGRADGQQLRRVPAREVCHIFHPLRAGAIRGEPELTQALVKMRDLSEYDDAEVTRKKITAMFTGFIVRPDEDPETSPVRPQGEDEDGTATVSLEPGTMQELGPGEDVKFSEPADVSSSYEPFIRQQLMAAATSAGTFYELLTGDMRGVNDRTLRVLLQEFRRRIQRIQYHLLVHQLCRPVWRAWMDAAVAAGALPLEAQEYADNRRSIQRAKWTPQAWLYINPVQDVQAHIEEIRAGLGSRSKAISEKGFDAEEIDAEIAADQQRADELGLVFDTDARRTARSGTAQDYLREQEEGSRES